MTTSWLNVRSSHSVYSSKIGTEPPETPGTIIAGPVRGDGYTWYEVAYAGGTTGWSVQNYLSAGTSSANGSTGTMSRAAAEALLASLYEELLKLLQELAALRNNA